MVYGFFALTFVTPTLLQDILNIGVGFTNALAAGLVLGVMIIPTIASLAEDAFSAVPAGPAPGFTGHGRQPDADHPARRASRPPSREWQPRSCSACPAPIGETMIVALAAGAQKNFSLDPREGMQTMTGFMAQTAGGESPVGSLVLQQPLRRGHAALPHHAGPQPDQHQDRPTIQAGLLMSVATTTAAATVTTTIATGKSRDRTPPVVDLPDRRCGSRCSSASSCSLALIVTTAIEGAPRFDTALLTNYTSVVAPRDRRLPRRHPRQPVADGLHGAVRGPARDRRRALPRGVRRPRSGGGTGSSRSTSRTSPPCRPSSTASWPSPSWP